MNAKHVRNADPSNPVPADVISILEGVIEERDRAMAKWGVQNHPDGTSDNAAARALREMAREDTDDAAKSGTLTWKLILMEEVREAFAEVDLAKLDAELEQVMQVCCVWREDLRRRMARSHDGRVQEALAQPLKPMHEVHTEVELAAFKGQYAAHVERFGDPRG